MVRAGLLVSTAVLIALAAPAAQAPSVVTGDLSTPLRPLGGDGNVGISNAVMRDQPEVRVLRVAVQPGGVRARHAHTDVRFHLFVPVSGPMTLDVDGRAVPVQPWQAQVLNAGTQHGFRNTGASVVDVMEIFVK
jgi:mannose-6-phosphate isomerase-like protein (cupin superfamily)